jgi:hypothetical protein
MMKPTPRALLGRLALAAVAVPAASPAPGGWTPVDPSAPMVRAVAGVAARYLSDQLGGDLVVERIAEAETRPVGGLQVRLLLRVAQVDDEVLGARRICAVTVWSKPWEQSEQVTGYTCTGAEPAGR